MDVPQFCRATAVERDDLPCLHSSTRGMRRDQPAVKSEQEPEGR